MNEQHLSLDALNEQIALLVAQTKALKEQQKKLRDHDRTAVIAELKAILDRHPGIKVTATELGLSKPKQSSKPRKERKVYHDPVKDRTWTEGSRAMPKWVRDATPGSLIISVIGGLESDAPEVQSETSVEAV